MARSKRPITLPAGPQRQPIRRRTTENPPETVTGDLNEPPPVSGEIHIDPIDTSSSQQVSPNKTAESATRILDEETLQAEEEERKLEEEYQMRLSAIKKKKEDAERKRREDEERLKKAEEERLKKEEEERRRKEEEERVRKEEEEKRRKEREDLERQKREAEEIERKQQEDERLRLEKEAIESSKKQPTQQTPTSETVEVEPMKPDDPSGKTVPKRRLRSQTTPTKSDATKKTSSKKQPDKGKSIAPSYSTSSVEMDSDPILSEHPHQSTVGTAHAPQGVPRQFTTPGAAAHFECISSQKMNLERGFDADFVEANLFIKRRVEAHDWKLITAPNRRANASLVREFYAEASQVKDPVVKVRGKTVKYSPGEINRVLGRPVSEVCAFAQFLKKMTVADEAKILKEIAAEGKDWGKDGQRKCLPAAALTTEAAIWFQFLRSSVSPTTHDTTLSMHKCALLYCLLTGRKINLGIIMHAAIHQARTRKKVILPLPCLVTALLIHAGVPTATEDQWLVSTSPIGEQTLKRMGRRLENESDVNLPKEPNVIIAEEHQVSTPKPTVGKDKASTSEQPAGLEDTLQKILRILQKLTYRVELLEATQRYKYQDDVKFWTYCRDRDEVVNQMLIQNNPELADVLPTFPEGICPGDESEAEEYGSEYSAATTPSVTPDP